MRRKQLSDGRRAFALVFDAGDEVVAGLRVFAEEQGMEGASFTGIGAFREATVAFFDWETKEYEEIPVAEQTEVLTLAGDVALADGGGLQVHAHAVLGKRDGTAHGGHLMHAIVRPTLEVVVEESPTGLRRRHDPESGLALIRL